MSLCRNRLQFSSKSERRSQDSAVAQTLNFTDSDSEDQNGDLNSSGFQQGSLFSPTSSFRTPDENCGSSFWDSGLCSPTPGASPKSHFQRNDCDSSMKMTSPIFNMDDSDGEGGISHSFDDSRIPPIPQTPYTPPHKKFRSLRLYDTPHTPKSLLQRAQRRVTRVNRDKLGKRVLDPLGPQANVNPFTASAHKSLTGSGIKRGRAELDSSLTEDSMDEDFEDDRPISKKLALHEINTSRYMEEFHEVCKLGDGEFGSVYKCINRLDGCTYAIKKSKTPVAGSAYERNALNEVYAHAVLGKHPHVVRYYSAWAENDHMYIQNEFCNGGSLGDMVAEAQGKHWMGAEERSCFSEAELKRLMIHLAQGLKYIHSQGLVHLDIKPGNIFVQCPASPSESPSGHQRQPSESGRESGLEEDLEPQEGEGQAKDEDEEENAITYKIGDLGHVTSVTSPMVEEGDCRYLPAEILHENFDHLPKADIFSLALTVYEAGGGADLPKNGPAWHAIRQGLLPDLPHISADFNNLLKVMVHKDPQARPSAANVSHHKALCPLAHKSKAQLRKELNAEKFKNEVLSRQLQEAQLQQQQPTPSGPAPVMAAPARNSRLIGRKVNRSMSTQLF